MNVDNGDVIPGLNEEWTLAGARLNEWIAGMSAFMMGQFLFAKPTRAMPLLIAIMVGTALGLAMIRRRFPDEVRGMRNYFMMLVGVKPPGIPAPSVMQPMWSGAPMQEFDEDKEFVTLKLDEMLALKDREQEEEKLSLR